MQIIGVPERPQALFLGFEEDDPSLEAMTSIVAGHLILESAFDLVGLRVADWDLIVVSGDFDWASYDVEGHLYALTFAGGTGPLKVTTTGRRSMVKLGYVGSTSSGQLHIAGDVPAPVDRRIRQDLVPALQMLDRRPFLEGTEAVNAQSPDAIGTVYVSDPDGHPIVGHFVRKGAGEDTSTGSCLALPIRPDLPELWLAAAMTLWRAEAADRFPERQIWRDSPTFMTSRQRAARNSIAELEQQRDQAQRRYELEEQRLRAEVMAAGAEAETGPLRLVISDGPDLVAAVIDAFEVLGFQVIDADQELDEGTAKSEDLRLTDPDDPAWTNITEVKGHTGGAKESVLLKLSNWAERFALRTKASPTSRWYVANQFKDTDPLVRQVILRGAEEGLEVFGQSGGLVIDTRDLFELQQRVVDGRLLPSDARNLLRTARGRFTVDT